MCCGFGAHCYAIGPLASSNISMCERTVNVVQRQRPSVVTEGLVELASLPAGLPVSEGHAKQCGCHPLSTPIRRVLQW
jgi:hypothetical protein